jgi:hypothetical protein
MSWRVTLTEGAELDEAAIRELWTFRLSIMRLKPHVAAEKDFEKFSGHCRQGRRVLRLRNARGQLCGSVVPLMHDGTFQGERYRFLVLARSQQREVYRRYVARCPRWQEGRTLPQVAEFSARKVARALLHVPQRGLRRLVRGRAERSPGR